VKRLTEVEAMLRDCQFVSMACDYEYFSDKVKQVSLIRMSLQKFDQHIVKLELIEPLEIDLFDDFTHSYISHVKAFSMSGQFVLSLDPYDEADDFIDDKDNYVFKAKSYRLYSTEL
jgi:hypothetical protein